jgi:hypothetical protein
MLSLRAYAAQSADDQPPGFMEYMQTTLGLGLLAIILDISALLRCVLVNSTRPSDNSEFELKSTSSELITEHKVFWNITYVSEVSLFGEKTPTYSPTECLAEQYPDQPRSRSRFRRIHDAIVLLYFAALATGIVGNGLLIAQHSNMQKNYINQALR